MRPEYLVRLDEQVHHALTMKHPVIDGWEDVPCYSQNTSTAMHAGERVGLFKMNCLSQRQDGTWEVVFKCDIPRKSDVIGTGATAATAICRAIISWVGCMNALKVSVPVPKRRSWLGRLWKWLRK